MCEMCDAKPTEFGEILPTFPLALATKDTKNVKAGQYAITDGQFTLVAFPEKPWPEPCEGMDDAALDALPPKGEVWKRQMEWGTAARVFDDAFLIRPDLGWELVEVAKKCGYDTANGGSFAMWLFHKAGVMLRDNPKGKTWEEQGATVEVRE